MVVMSVEDNKRGSQLILPVLGSAMMQALPRTK